MDWMINGLFFVGVLVVNSLANILPIAGKTTAEISDIYDNLFTPAGFVFSIWAIIYILLTLFVIYQALPSQRRDAGIKRISTLFKINMLSNMLWIFAWHYELMIISLSLMLIILVTLIQLYLKLFSNPPISVSQLFMLYLPFSIYLAWITVATIANISAFQVAFGLEDLLFTAFDWTLIKLAVACVISIVMLWRRGDVIFSLVTSWASYGIFVKHAENIAVSNAAYMVCVILIMLTIYYAYLQMRIKLE